MVHSIDRMKIVRKMDRRLKKIDKKIDVLIQVNVSREASKNGIDPSQDLSFVKEAASFQHVQIKGLMTIVLFLVSGINPTPIIGRALTGLTLRIGWLMVREWV